jgi:hypothetical protein
MHSCSSNRTEFQMQGQSPDIDFSLSELEQAGLLDSAELHSSEVSSIPRPLAHGDRRSHNIEFNHPQLVVSQKELQRQAASSKALSFLPQVQPQLDTNVKSQALELEHASEVLGTRSSRAENERKQASNREHQRRFRLRQKVATTACNKQLPDLSNHN